MLCRSGPKVQKTLEVERKKRQRLLKEIENIKSKISDIKQKELPNTEYEIDSLRERIKELQTTFHNMKLEKERESQETLLLKAFEERCNQQNEILNEYNNRVSSITKQMSTLKTVNIGHVRKLLEDRLRTYLGSSDEMEDEEDDKISPLLGNVSQFLGIISEITKEHTISLKQSVDDIRLHRVQDLEKERSMEVDRLLDMERRKHITRFSEAERYVNSLSYC